MLYTECVNYKELTIDNLPVRSRAPKSAIFYQKNMNTRKYKRVRGVGAWERGKQLTSMNKQYAPKECTSRYAVHNGVVSKTTTLVAELRHKHIQYTILENSIIINDIDGVVIYPIYTTTLSNAMRIASKQIEA